MDNRAKRMVGAATMVVALVLALIAPMGSAGASSADNVRFCHATSSVSNPYVMITTDPESIVFSAHQAHEGPLFDPLTMVSGDTWGDVIPPFPGFPGSSNWDPDGPDSAEEQCLGGGIAPEGLVSVVKTADTSFTRTHAWSIDKSVSPNPLQLSLGDTNEIATWDVDVTYDGSDDGDYMVFGTITVTNGGTVDAEITDVTDGLAGTLVDCSGDPDDADDGLPETLQPDQDLECTYSADVEDDSGGTNTATAEGDYLFSDVDDSLLDEPFSETGVATYSFGAPTTEVNDTVQVTDTQSGFDDAYGDVFLDAADYVAGDIEPFTYTRAFNRSDYPERGITCVGETIPNTAAVVGDNEAELDSATATLTVQVQCLVAGPGQTATGRGFKWSATKKAPSNWFMYTPWTTTSGKTGLNPGPVDIVAGQSIVIGSASGSGSAPRTLAFNLTGGWELKTVTNNVKIQPLATCAATQTYMQPGSFSIKTTISTTSFNVNVGSTTAACYGIHLDVVQWVPSSSWS